MDVEDCGFDGYFCGFGVGCSNGFLLVGFESVLLLFMMLGALRLCFGYLGLLSFGICGLCYGF